MSPKAKTPQPSGKLAAIAALLSCIRGIAQHNTRVPLDYVANPAPFSILTDKQRARIHSAACVLFGLDSTATHADLQATAAQFASIGRAPRFVWVHQRYSPYVCPKEKAAGKRNRDSLMTLFGKLAKAGMIEQPIAPNGQPLAVEYIATVQAAETAKLVRQQPREGGYIVAVAADDDANKAEQAKYGAAKTSSTATPADLLAQLG